jgi:putative two-component system response regulator
MVAPVGVGRRAATSPDTLPDIQLPEQQTPAEQAALARELSEDRHALVLALTETLCWHDENARAHLRRVQAFVRCLAEEAANLPGFRGRIDADFIQLLEWSSPLHDLGKVAVPAAILQKPGPLDVAERRIAESHTVIGAGILENAAGEIGCGGPFLAMARNMARFHHERFDGTGYPDRLAGEAIPLEARIAAIADVYDALRSSRRYKTAWSHERVLQVMLVESPGHFDPELLLAFERCAARFAEIFAPLG